MQPNKSIKSEALCYKRLSHLGTETQEARQWPPHCRLRLSCRLRAADYMLTVAVLISHTRKQFGI